MEQWKCHYKDCRAICCKQSKPLTIFDTKKNRTAQRFGQPILIKTVSGLLLKKGKHGCIFLDDDCKCAIYTYLICRLLPFEMAGIAQSDETILHLKPINECQGYGSTALMRVSCGR